MFSKYIIERTKQNQAHLGKWICHLDTADWREYTAMWDDNLESLFKFVAGMGGHITGWQARDNDIVLTVEF